MTADYTDEAADYCTRNHTDRPQDGCDNCQIRGEIQHCATCGADHVDGRWFTGLGSTTPNGCDHEAIVDDWDREVTCSVMHSTGERCGDAVAAGKQACGFHQSWLDNAECDRIYQRMVAVR